ncbi:MAG: sigE 10 [Myxococcaceae bacterium]|nr:sigE 10 [Myxococcaceae bacterium]
MGVARAVAAHVLLGCALVGCGSYGGPADRAEAAPSATSASNALAEMYQRYASARTYEDHGVLIDVIRPGDGAEPSTSRTVFDTAYDRSSGSFRFEYTKTHDRFFDPDRHVIWRRGFGPAHTWWTTEPRIIDDELDAGLAAMAGVSGTTSRTVPSMLLGWAAGMKRDLGYVPDGDGIADGVPCLRMSTRDESEILTLWIGKVDHALRRVTSRRNHAGVHTAEDIARLTDRLPEERRQDVSERMRKPHPFVAEATIDYSPVFDRPIDPARFTFTPPPPSSEESAPQ